MGGFSCASGVRVMLTAGGHSAVGYLRPPYQILSVSCLFVDYGLALISTRAVTTTLSNGMRIQYIDFVDASRVSRT